MAMFCRVCCTVLMVVALTGCGGRNGSNGGSNGGSVTKVENRQAAIALSGERIDAGISDTVRFGRVKAGEKVIRSIGARNNADQPLVVLSVASTCGCINLEMNTSLLRPDSVASWVVTLDTSGYSDWFINRFTISTSLSDKPYHLYVEADIE